MRHRTLTGLFAAVLALPVTLAGCSGAQSAPLTSAGPPIFKRIAARAKGVTCPAPLVSPGSSVDVQPRPGLNSLAPGAGSAAPSGGTGGGWVMTPTFQGKNLPRFLRDRCVYTWKGGGAPLLSGLPLDKLTSVSEDRGVVVAQQRRTPPGGLTESMARMLGQQRNALVEQTGARLAGAEPAQSLDVAKLLASVASEKAKPVFIGFPDSSPSNDPAERKDGDAVIPVNGHAHGFNMAWITRYLTCPEGEGGRCLSEPLTELAFDGGDDDTPGSGRGAAFGSRTRFAWAINRIVERWLERRGDDLKHLILNLAAGWEPAYECVSSPTDNAATGEAEAGEVRFGDPLDKAAFKTACLSLTGSDGTGACERAAQNYEQFVAAIASSVPACGAAVQLKEASQQVLAALARASCHGALIIAAAGNDPGYADSEKDPAPSGPMLPAAWERVPALRGLACSVLGVELGVEASASEGPLVHAVAGVDGADVPILVSRKQSRSRLAAPASLLVGYPDTLKTGYAPPDCKQPPCKPSYALTGTSVSATVASSIAAAVWAVSPRLLPLEVMDNLYSTGTELPTATVDFCSGAQREDACKAVHRVSMCNALRAACEPAGKEECVSAGAATCASREPYQGREPPKWSDLLRTPRTDVSFARSLSGFVTPEPNWPCPACIVAVLEERDGRIHYRLEGSIDFDVLRDDSLTWVSMTLHDSARNQVACQQSWTQQSWGVGADPLVDARFDTDSRAAPTTALVKWLGGPSGSLYTQELPLR